VLRATSFRYCLCSIVESVKECLVKCKIQLLKYLYSIYQLVQNIFPGYMNFQMQRYKNILTNNSIQSIHVKLFNLLLWQSENHILFIAFWQVSANPFHHILFIAFWQVSAIPFHHNLFYNASFSNPMLNTVYNIVTKDTVLAFLAFFQSYFPSAF
jgi:hypothetical protein